jgi:cytoskeletal protein CcmA (bactofilin family)
VKGDASFNSKVTVTGDASLNNKVTVARDASFNGNLDVSNNFAVKGDASFNSKVTVTGDASFNNKFTVARDASFNGNLDISNNFAVKGDASFNSKVTVTGDASLNNRVTVARDASFNGNLDVSNNFAVKGDASFNSKVTVTGDASFNGNVTFKNLPTSVVLNPTSDNQLATKAYVDTKIPPTSAGWTPTTTNATIYPSGLQNVYIGKNGSLTNNPNYTLSVDGSANFTGQIVASSPTASTFQTNPFVISRADNGTDPSTNMIATIGYVNSKTSGGYWAVDGTSLYPTATTYKLAIGKSTATAPLDVSGNALITGKLTITSDASFNNKVTVTGDASFNNKVTVARDASFNGNLDVSNNFAVKGDASFNNKVTVARDASFNGNTTFFTNPTVTTDNGGSGTNLSLVTKQYVDIRTVWYPQPGSTNVYAYFEGNYQKVAIGKNEADVPLDVVGAANISGLITANGGLTVPSGKTLTLAPGASASGLVDTTTTQTIGGTKIFSSPITGNISGNAATATAIAGGSTNQILYQTGVNTTGFIGTGAAGQVLTYNASGAPSWQTFSSSGVSLSGQNNWTSSGSNTFSGDVSFNGTNAVKFLNYPTYIGTANPTTDAQLITKKFADASYATISSLTNYGQIGGKNSWTTAGTNTFFGDVSFNTNNSVKFSKYPVFSGTGNPLNVAEFITLGYSNNIYQSKADMSAYLTIAAAGFTYAALSGTNAFTGNNSFNTNLPTSTLTPTSDTQLITKTYADTTYASKTGTNAFTGTNTFNTTLPTSTSTPTASNQLITKTYADTTFQSISGMSSYLTTSSASSTYQTIANMSGYLTSATAASTYAALSGATFIGLINANGGLTVPSGRTLTLATGAFASGLVDTTTNQTIGGTKTFTSIISGSISGNAATATTATTATRATAIAGGQINQIPYQTGVNTTGFITAGTAGQVLTYNNSTTAPSWQASGSNLWTLTGTTITPTTPSNSLQIGTDASSANLTVYGPITTSQTINNSFFSASSVYQNYSLFIGEYTTADAITNIKNMLNSGFFAKNTGIGTNALASISTQTYNCTAVGVFSMSGSKANSNCTAIGLSSGAYDISGNNNTYLGASTGQPSTDKNIYTNSTAIGYLSRITESNQIVLGTATENVSIPGKVNNTSIIYKNISTPTVTGSPTISTSGTYSVYKFTGSGSITFPAGVGSVRFGYIVVGGGGGGGGGRTTPTTGGAGGGAGGAVVYCPISSGPSFAGGTTYTITVGGGGNRGGSSQDGFPGGASSIGSFATAQGGLGGNQAPVTSGTAVKVTGNASESTGATAIAGGNGGGVPSTGQAREEPTRSDTLNNMTDISGYYYTNYSGGGGSGYGNSTQAKINGGTGGQVNVTENAVVAGRNGLTTVTNGPINPTAGASNTGSGGGGGFSPATTGTNSVGLGAAGGSGVVIIYFSTTPTSSYTNSLYYDSIGNYALGTGFPSITSGSLNLSLGFQALLKNTTGTSNVAVGNGSLVNSTIGSNKTSIGFATGSKDISGNNNTYLGSLADVSSNTVIYNNSTAIGYNSKIDASNQIVLGTATETVTIPGSIRFPNFSDILIPGPNQTKVISPPLLSFYTITGTAGTQIQIPHPNQSLGSLITFRRGFNAASNTTGDIIFYVVNFQRVFIRIGDIPPLPANTASQSALLLANSSCTQFFSNGTLWYQLFIQ